MHAPRCYPRCLQWLWIARKARFGQCGRRDRIARDACTELLLQSIVDVTQTIELQLHQEASEPPRIWWRLQFLRKWSYEQVEQIFC